MLKVGAVGGIIALRFALVRKNKAEKQGAPGEAEAVPASRAPRRDSHPVSRKKKRRRRR
jgi:hypothetical protein